MDYSQAVELCTRVQHHLNDDKNVFVRASQMGNNYAVGVRRTSIDPELLQKLLNACGGFSQKKLSIQAVDADLFPEDVFRPVVGQWHTACLIAIIY